MVRFRLVHHSLHHISPYTPPTSGVLSALRELQLICLPEDDPIFPEGGWWWLGYSLINDQPVAFGILEPSQQWLDTAYLSRAGVLPSCRGKGLQRRLIGLRERMARKKGFTWMISDTTENTPSANNLIKAGYKLLDPSSPWANTNSLYWAKKLSKG